MPAATIAFAPFDNLSGDPTGDYFARGFVEDVATELSRFGTVEVLHPNAVWTSLMRGGDDDRRVQAGHIVHGSVRRAGDAVRVNVQLVDVVNGRQIWADRYEATASDLHAVQDAIAARIARTLVVQVDEARLDVARRAPLATLDVYDCWLRGLECIRKGTVEADAEARRYFERALEIDPAYARAYAGLSLSHFNEWSCQAWAQWDEKERLAHEYAARAAALDQGDAMVQVVLGRILVYRRRYDEAAHHLERALQLNPNDTDVLVHGALCQAYLGDPETALATATRAMRLNPKYPPWYAAPAGLAHGDAPVLDERARRELRARVRELQQEIDEADSVHDAARAERAREELDQIVEHLSGALGIGGRARPLGSAAERARSAVTWRIRNAIRKIASAHSRLGRHLENSVRTGTFCVYEPETPTNWVL
jgi:TolB-like protein/Tfp pilus assembly protein PilF